ncbi:MAG: hypothetical protein JHC95_17670 [Solirubrobacteraceae bacterium]|nr:hypothetical protein [Solirubrobacteraceae bacterium]
MAAAEATSGRFSYRSAVSDPFEPARGLGGWEDVGIVDFPARSVWYRRLWISPGNRARAGETIGLLGPERLTTIKPDGTATDIAGALDLVNATSNPLGMLRLLDPAFTVATPAGAGRWRIEIDLPGAREALGATALGPGMVHLRPSLAATAQVRDGELEVVGMQVGVWGEPHAWAALRFNEWGTTLPVERVVPPRPWDFKALRTVLVPE